jgi:hypothetical protein
MWNVGYESVVLLGRGRGAQARGRPRSAQEGRQFARLRCEGILEQASPRNGGYVAHGESLLDMKKEGRN